MVTINVTQELIDKTVTEREQRLKDGFWYQSSTECLLAQAMKPYFPHVEVGFAWAFDHTNKLRIPLGALEIDAINNFDHGHYDRLYPFEFEIGEWMPL